MNSSIIKFVYSITYSIVILAAIMTGLFAANMGVPFVFRIMYFIIGISALVQVVFTIHGYKLRYNE